MKKVFIFFVLIVLLSNSFAQSPYFGWAKQFKGANHSTNICMDAEGNVYNFGNFKNKIDVDPGALNQEIFSKGDNDLFVSKLDQIGNLIWAKTFGGVGQEWAFDLIVDSIGNSYLYGTFSDSVDFNPDLNADTFLNSFEGEFFLLKLDSAGELVWFNQFPFWFGTIQNRKLSFDRTGNIVFTGQFRGNVDFDPGPGQFFLNNSNPGISNSFICKLKSDNTFIWAKQLTGGNNFGTSLFVDQVDNILVAGEYWDSTDFDPDTSTSFLFSDNPQSRYLLKLNKNGQFMWVKEFVDKDGLIYINDLHTNNSNEILVTGHFRKTPDFDPDSTSFTMSSKGFSDIYMMKLNQNGKFLWAKGIGGDQDDYAQSITTDLQNNIWVTGSFQNEVDFDPGAGNYTLEGSKDIFLLKLKNNGEFFWAGKIGHNGVDISSSIYSDKFDNLYVCGKFNFNPDFDPGPGEYILDAGNSSLNPAVFNLQLKGAIVGIDEAIQDGKDISLFPNPSDGMATIILDKHNANTTVRIINSQGQLENQIQYYNQHSFQFDLPTQKGLYFIEVRLEHLSKVFKVIRN